MRSTQSVMGEKQESWNAELHISKHRTIENKGICIHPQLFMEQNKERSFLSGRFWFTPSVFHHSPINNDRVAKSYYLIVETDF